jgi:AraC family transcriptional regulator, regulatory protein of adaptative response / methylated-DNA-[protein]-cysteine methyltransferase
MVPSMRIGNLLTLQSQIGSRSDTPRPLLESLPGSTEGDLWNAIISRDFGYGPIFFYGVRSTKIYCRPTCASRKPDRRNVTFFSSSEEAERSGYRPCLRCKPDEERIEQKSSVLVERVCRFIQENYTSKINLSRLGSEFGVSSFHLHRVFRQVTGISPRQYLESVRLTRLKQLLKQGESATRSTYRSGYNTSSWLYAHRDSKFGMSPGIYKSGGEGLKIRYTTVACEFGSLLVAATERGICFVCLGDSEAKIAPVLKAEYPRASISKTEDGPGGDRLQAWVTEMLEYLEGKNNQGLASLPVDIRATAFQSRVWQELQKIPFGKTASYSDIATRIGEPNASRAVANACGSNPVALVIPCHRVIRKGGNLGGYRWGLMRKKRLLEIESGSSHH